MEVIVNNSVKQLNEGDKLDELIRQLNLTEQTGIAIAINNKVVSKSNWMNTTLFSNDKITIIKATQGG